MTPLANHVHIDFWIIYHHQRDKALNICSIEIKVRKLLQLHNLNIEYFLSQNFSQIYVRSLLGSEYDPIKEIECRVPYTEPNHVTEAGTQHNIQMSFFSDSRFTKQFESFSNEVDRVLYLGGNKVMNQISLFRFYVMLIVLVNDRVIDLRYLWEIWWRLIFLSEENWAWWAFIWHSGEWRWVWINSSRNEDCM
jgi:hypothetical protein